MSKNNIIDPRNMVKVEVRTKFSHGLKFCHFKPRTWHPLIVMRIPREAIVCRTLRFTDCHFWNCVESINCFIVTTNCFLSIRLINWNLTRLTDTSFGFGPCTGILIEWQNFLSLDMDFRCFVTVSCTNTRCFLLIVATAILSWGFTIHSTN